MEPTVRLRDMVEADLPVFFEHACDRAAQHMAAFVSKDRTKRDVFMAHWAKIMADDTIVRRTIFLGARDQIVGHVLCHSWFSKPEITYWIDRAYWGRGMATQALKLFLTEVTERPLYASAAKDNIGSIRVLEKCGFVRTGIERGFAGARGEEIEEVMMELNAISPAV